MREKGFAKFHMRSPVEMGETEIRQYMLHMVDERQIAHGTYNQIRAALRFLYTVTLRRPTEIAHVPVRRKKARLPVILHPTEVQALLAAIRSPKYRGVMMAQYACGLRISEACRLRCEDIDAARMVIHVRQGKGGRDRYTVLSVQLLSFLREYWRRERPQGPWLFCGLIFCPLRAHHDDWAAMLTRAIPAVGNASPTTPSSRVSGTHGRIDMSLPPTCAGMPSDLRRRRGRRRRSERSTKSTRHSSGQRGERLNSSRSGLSS